MLVTGIGTQDEVCEAEHASGTRRGHNPVQRLQGLAATHIQDRELQRRERFGELAVGRALR